MWSSSNEIAAGDLVIVWLTRESVQPLVITPGKEFNGKFGVYRHSDLVGIPYGSKVGSRNGKGFVHLLRPTPELWTMALPHRTQILYLADIAFVVSYLNIRPGSQVIEAGTGSGSFSHSVARTIGSSGHLYSYEFHEARVTKARDEFRGHGLSDIITLTHRNVCKDGFTVIDQVDSVFLDLPAPWDAVQHAKKALRKDRSSRICCFSPCMEQVLRTVAALNEAGFTDITMYETLLRPHEVHAIPLLPISEVGDRLKRSEIRREEKRLKQVALSQTKRDKSSKKRKRDPRENDDSSEHRVEEEAYAPHVDAQESIDTEESRTEVKKIRTEEGVDGDHTLPLKVECVDQSFAGCSSERAQSSVALSAEAESVVKSLPEKAEEPEVTVTRELVPASPTLSQSEPPKMIVSRVVNEVRGHTSYLTFAVLLPTMLPNGNPDLLPKDASSEIEKVDKTEKANTHDVDMSSPDSVQ